MNPYGGQPFDSTFAVAELHFLALSALVALLGALGSYLLNAAGLTALFARTGVDRWKAWIPYYQNFVFLRLGGQSGYWVWLSLIPSVGIITRVFLCIGMYRIQIGFRRDAAFLIVGAVVPWLWALLIGLGSTDYDPTAIVERGFPAPLIGFGSPGAVERVARADEAW